MRPFLPALRFAAALALLCSALPARADEDLGTLLDDDGRRYGFHCTAIADGTPLAFPSSWSCLSPLWRRRPSCMSSLHKSSMYGYTVHVKRFVVKVSQEARSSSIATNH